MEISKSAGGGYFSTDHLKPELKTRAVRGAGTTVLFQAVNYGIQMIGTVILARILTPSDFGLVAMATSIYVFFRICRNFGLIDATIQKEEINHKQISTLFWVNIAFSGGITLLFMALGPLMSRFYHEPRLTLIVFIISFDFILGGSSAQHRALLKRNMLFFEFSVNEITASLVSTVVAVILALSGWGYWALAIKYVIYALSETVGAWVLCKWRPGLPARGTGVRPMLNFGVNMLKNHTLDYFSQNLDKVLIGWRNGAQSLGYYNRAYHLFMAPAQQLSFPLVGVAVATLSRLLNDPNKFRRYFLKALSMIAFVGLPVSALLTIMGDDIILLLLGPQWKMAAKIFSILGLGIGIQILYGTQCWLHISQGRADRWFRWNVAATAITVLFVLIGLPFGPLGVASAYTASLYVLLIPGLWYAGKLQDIKLSSIVAAIWKYYLSALAAGILCWFMLHDFGSTRTLFTELNIFMRLLSGSLLCLCLYLIMVIILFGSVKPIRQFVSVSRDMIPRFRQKMSG